MAGVFGIVSVLVITRQRIDLDTIILAIVLGQCGRILMWRRIIILQPWNL